MSYKELIFPTVIPSWIGLYGVRPSLRPQKPTRLFCPEHTLWLAPTQAVCSELAQFLALNSSLHFSSFILQPKKSIFKLIQNSLLSTKIASIFHTILKQGLWGVINVQRVGQAEINLFLQSHCLVQGTRLEGF